MVLLLINCFLLLLENESEESTHFFPTAGPSSTEEKDGPETSSPNKQSKSSEHSQFDGTLATLSGHLLVSVNQQKH